ncbi:MAG: PAS domain S-box protein [Nitrospira sp.]
MSNSTHITHFGLPGIDRIPFGMHTCHFYRDQAHLVSALVPYFVAGLRGNERCLWITAPPLPVHEAIDALRGAWNGVDGAIQAGAIRILDFDQWYASSAGLKGPDVVQLWLKEEAAALADGYHGLRIAGNTSFLKENDWSAFMEYEQTVTTHFKGRRITALCSYAWTQCTDHQVNEVLSTHHGELQSTDNFWTMVYPEQGLETSRFRHAPDLLEKHGPRKSETSSGANNSRLDELIRARLAAIVESSDDAIISKNLDGIITSWNRGAERIFGYTAQEAIGQPVTMLMPPDRVNEEPSILQRIRNREKIDHYETIRRHKDGTLLDISLSVSPIIDTDGHVIGASKIARDITERRRVEVLLHESVERFRMLADNMAQLAWTCDQLGNVTWYNQRWLDYTGLSFEEMKEWGWKKVHHPDHVDRVVASVTRSRESGDLWEDTFPLKGKDGHYRWFLSRAIPIRDTEGGIVRWFGTNTDVTDQRQTEEALREAQRRLLRWNEELEQAVNFKTAELQQSQERLRVLTTELNLTEQRERKQLAIELHDHLQQMLVLGKIKLGQGKRLAATTPAILRVMNETDTVFSDALKYTRMLVTELSPPVLRDHGLSAGLKWLGEYMQKHDMSVAVTVPDEEVPLPEDHVVLLFQSVRELLINSSKHAGTGQASVTMDHGEGVLTIKVRDNGTGFDVATADGGDISSGGVSSKFGLLSIRERMRALRGSFDIQSSPGGGTTATLMLPLSDGATKSDTEVVLGSANSGSRITGSSFTPNIRVLLVDDHLMVRQGLKAILNAYTDIELVGEAGTGEEAVRLVDKLRPTVVVMDINLPRLDGIEATKQIMGLYPETVVIGLSVNASKETEEAIKRAGAVRLLTKDAAVEQLYETVVEIIKERSNH